MRQKSSKKSRYAGKKVWLEHNKYREVQEEIKLKTKCKTTKIFGLFFPLDYIGPSENLGQRDFDIILLYIKCFYRYCSENFIMALFSGSIIITFWHYSICVFVYFVFPTSVSNFHEGTGCCLLQHCGVTTVYNSTSHIADTQYIFQEK